MNVKLSGLNGASTRKVQKQYSFALTSLLDNGYKVEATGFNSQIVDEDKIRAAKN